MGFFAEMALLRKEPLIKDEIPNYFFGGNFAAPEADFRCCNRLGLLSLLGLGPRSLTLLACFAFLLCLLALLACFALLCLLALLSECMQGHALYLVVIASGGG